MNSVQVATPVVVPYSVWVPMLGERLAQARKLTGRRQADLAAELGERYDATMISHVERDRSSLLLDGAAEAARVLNVSLDWLVGLTDDPTPASARSNRSLGVCRI